MKFLRLIIILAVIGGAGFYAWTLWAAPKAAVEPVTTRVTRGTVEETVLATGALEASAVVSVGAEVSGRIETLDVALGDAVQAGDVIAQIDSLNQENAVKAAEAALASMEAQKRAKEASVVKAEQALARSQQLSDQNLVSKADYESANADLEMAKADIDGLNAQIDQAKLSVESAQLDLSRTTITAPVAGTIVAVLVNEGTTVNASSATPTIVKIAQLDTMIIKAEISEADITKVQPGQRAYFTILGEPDTRIDATLLATEPAPTAINSADTGMSSDSAIYYNGVFRVDNPDHKLRIAMTAQVTIVLEDAPDALVLSSGALGSAGPDGTYLVHVYDPTTGESRPATIEIGLNNNVQAEVKSGLADGDLVISASAGTQAAVARTGGGGGGVFGGGMGGPRG